MDYFRKLVIIGVVFVSTTVNSFALKAEYRFENCDGSATSKNYQGGGLNGTLKGDAKITLNGGQIQNGLTLSGDGMMSVSHSSKLDLIENLTISFWVNPKQKKRQALLVKGGAGSDKLGANAEYSLVLWENGKFKYKHNGQADLFSESDIPLKKWTHIALVRDNGLKEIKIYVNGKFDAKVDYTIDPSSSGKERLIIGSGEFYSSTMHNFKGSLDEIKIYNTALSQTEIGEIYGKEKGKKHATGDCASTHKCPKAIDDISNFADGSIRVDILSNDIVYDSDKCELDSSTVVIVSNPSDSVLSDNNKSLKVPNEGIWRVKGDGTVEFISEESFYGNPTDIKYRVSDSCGGVSNSGYIHLVRVAVSQPVECVTSTPSPTSTPAPTHTPNVTSTPSPTPMPTHTPSVTPSPSPTPTHTPSATSTPSSTPTPTPTSTGGSEATVTIGDRVWYDRNGNGIQDGNEGGVEGVIVVLFNSSGTVAEQTRTDADGEYHFNVHSGEYSLAFNNLPSGYIFTSQDRGGDDTKDSDVNSAGRISNIVVEDKDNLTYDAGVVSSSNSGVVAPPPVVGGVDSNFSNSEGVANCECDDYKSTIPTLNKLGVVTILILMGLLGAFFIREEKVDFNF